jgi:NADP-dependent aldehyde dehydrogenase
MAFLGTSFIGLRRGAPGGAVFSSRDARSGEPFGPTLHAARPEDAREACELAWAAFRAWRKRPDADRATFLRAVADGLDARVADLVEVTPRETALPEGRVRGETARTSGQLRMFAALLESPAWRDERREAADPARQPAPKPALRARRIALGPVAVFGAANFPLAFSTAGGDTASAWAAGCPVVVKGHPAHPLTAEIVAEVVVAAARATGQPEGVFSLLLDPGHDIGAALVAQPRIQAVGFTGSRAGGLALMRLAAARPRPIPVFAEMSSVNPVFLLPGALAARGEAIADAAFGSVTLGSGQFCTCPGVLVGDFAEPGAGFLARLRERITAAPALPMLTPAIAENYAGTMAKLAALPGVRKIAEGAAAESRQGQVVALQASVEAVLAHPEALAEAFGPCTLLVQAAGQAEMRQLAEACEGQLTCAAHGEAGDWAAHADLLDDLELLCGRLVFNGFPTGVEVNSAIVHGGPYPATSDGRSSSVGTLAIERFLRPFCWQDEPMGR